MRSTNLGSLQTISMRPEDEPTALKRELLVDTVASNSTDKRIVREGGFPAILEGGGSWPLSWGAGHGSDDRYRASLALLDAFDGDDRAGGGGVMLSPPGGTTTAMMSPLTRSGMIWVA
jgi:hypothetical protein